MAELTKEQAIADYTEFMRRTQVGAYEERSVEHYLTSTWPEDGVEESLHNLDTWAAKQELAFHWQDDSQIYKLEPMSPEERTGLELEQVCGCASSQSARDIPNAEICDVMPYQCHLQSDSWYVEVYLRRHDPQQSIAVALYRVCRFSGLSATSVNVKEL